MWVVTVEVVGGVRVLVAGVGRKPIWVGPLAVGVLGPARLALVDVELSENQCQVSGRLLGYRVGI